MYLVPTRPVVNPGICFICEMANEGPYVDTEHAWDPEVWTHLNGRKYVCEGCAKSIGQSVGLVERAVYASLQDALDTAQAEIKELVKQADLVKAAKQIAKAVGAGNAKSPKIKAVSS